MQLVLVYFDNLSGPRNFFSLPPEVSPHRLEIVEKLLDVGNEGYYEHHNHGEDEFIVAYNIFEINSVFARGNLERLLIALIIDEQTKPGIFKANLEDFVTTCKKNPEIYKGLYYQSQKEARDSKAQYQKLRDFFFHCYEACKRNPNAQKPGKMIVLGLRSVGKTSILNRLNNQDIDTKPTLGISVIKSVVDNFQFFFYDMSGQKSIRRTWFDQPVFPNAVIFVIDCAQIEENKEAQQVFDEVMHHYFGKLSREKLKPNTPVLILGNKIDLNPKYKIEEIEKLLTPRKYKINYRIGMVSALKNIGIEENFKWLIKEFLFS